MVPSPTHSAPGNMLVAGIIESKLPDPISRDQKLESGSFPHEDARSDSSKRDAWIPAVTPANLLPLLTPFQEENITWNRSQSSAFSSLTSSSTLVTPSSPPNLASPADKPAILCHICGAGFARVSNRNKHIRSVHEGHRPHHCKSCDAKFAQKSALHNHTVVIHLKKKPYPCDQCGAAFGQSGDLNRHKRCVHDRIRQYQCPQCPSTFGLRSQLSKHLKIIHEKERPQGCQPCGAMFGEAALLRRHLETKHSVSDQPQDGESARDLGPEDTKHTSPSMAISYLCQ